MIAMTNTYPVVLIPQTDGGYFVDCPSLPGCHSQGETVEEALENIREAIQLVLEDLAATGESVPPAAAPLLTEVSIAS